MTRGRHAPASSLERARARRAVRDAVAAALEFDDVDDELARRAGEWLEAGTRVRDVAEAGYIRRDRADAA